MEFLTVEQILFLHARLIDETGGSHGVRDLGLLQSAVARPRATFGGQNLYASHHTKAAALMESLVRNHPFVDGNKRTGVVSAAIFLKRNGYRLIASNQDVEDFTLRVAAGQVNLEKIAAWWIRHTERMTD